jgi:hypothetical protein
MRGFNKKNKKKKKLKMIAFSLMTASIYNEMAKREIIMKLLLPFFPILFGKPKYTSISRKDHANVYINVIHHFLISCKCVYKCYTSHTNNIC